MKKKGVIIICIVLLLFLGYLGFKWYMLNLFTIHSENSEHNKLVIGLNNQDSMTINTQTILEEEYLIFNGYKITMNVNNINSGFMTSIGKMYVNRFLEEDLTGNKISAKISREERQKFLNEKQIKNDYDYIEYIKKNDPINNNIFTSLSAMKKNYLNNYIIEYMLPIVDKLTIINGDYEGFMLTINKNFKEVHILENNKTYIFTFAGESKYTDEDINNILNTLIIE